MQGQGMTHGARRSSPRRLALLTIIMVGFAAASFLPSLFSRGTTGLTSTATNLSGFFIPIWLSLTIVTVIISMWFAKFLLEAERNRDSETQAPPSH